MKLTEALEIPPQCTNCPGLARLAGMYDKQSAHNRQFGLNLMDGIPSTELLATLIDEGRTFEEAMEYVRENPEYCRKLQVEALKMADAELENLAELGRDAIEACLPSGTIELRGVQDGVLVVATHCMSLMIDRRSNPDAPEPALVKRYYGATDADLDYPA